MRLSATLPTAFQPMMQQWDADSAASAEGQVLDQVRALDRFLSSVEKRAFRIARIAVRHDDDALDIVQDAMLQLARRYGQRPEQSGGRCSIEFCRTGFATISGVAKCVRAS